MVVLDDGIGVGLFDHMIDLRSIVRIRLLSLHRVLDDFARLHLNCVHDLLDMRPSQLHSLFNGSLLDPVLRYNLQLVLRVRNLLRGFENP